MFPGAVAAGSREGGVLQVPNGGQQPPLPHAFGVPDHGGHERRRRLLHMSRRDICARLEASEKEAHRSYLILALAALEQKLGEGL